MTHWFEYSIGAVHMKNAKDCVEKMQNVTFKEADFNYGREEFEIFFNNTRYGVLAIYSINATLETIVAITSKKLRINEKHFNSRVDTLVKKGVITNNVPLQNLKELRQKRNLITHWEKNHTKLLGTSSYLPIMFTEAAPQNKVEELISMFIPERISQYIVYLMELLNDIICRIDKEKYMKLYYSLEQIKEEWFVVGY